MNQLTNIIARSISRLIPGFFRAKKSTEHGRVVQRPNKACYILFGVLISLTLLFIFFAVIGLLSVYSRDHFEPLSIIFLLISIVLAGFVLYFYLSIIKTYLIEDKDSIIIGSAKGEITIFFNEITEVVKNQGSYLLYYKLEDKLRVNTRLFTPSYLNEYIRTHFVTDRVGLTQRVFVRKKVTIPNDRSNFSHRHDDKLGTQNKYDELMKRINEDVVGVKPKPYLEKLEFVLDYIPKMMNDPEFKAYFVAYYQLTMNELNGIKKGTIRYVSFTRMMLDHGIIHNDLISILFDIAQEYRDTIYH